jgi:hypothetical protein
MRTTSIKRSIFARSMAMAAVVVSVPSSMSDGCFLQTESDEKKVQDDTTKRAVCAAAVSTACHQASRRLISGCYINALSVPTPVTTLISITPPPYRLCSTAWQHRQQLAARQQELEG